MGFLKRIFGGSNKPDRCTAKDDNLKEKVGSSKIKQKNAAEEIPLTKEALKGEKNEFFCQSKDSSSFLELASDEGAQRGLPQSAPKKTMKSSENNESEIESTFREIISTRYNSPEIKKRDSGVKKINEENSRNQKFESSSSGDLTKRSPRTNFRDFRIENDVQVLQGIESPLIIIQPKSNSFQQKTLGWGLRDKEELLPESKKPIILKLSIL